ncbi:hypothetical protein AAMO2058_000105600 [Amorphochlora amoebiformis]|uniref:G-patch domain-containing protein n=1 Tax=Amorphochlora amoebiformis TaxID=1561963 RepID=A0A7S0DKM2_9EUKA
MEGDFSLPRGRPRDDFDYSATGVSQVSVKTPIQSSNKGYKLLQKMGWSKGTGIGRSGQGIVEPVQLKIQDHGMSLGIGKATEYDEQAEAATANRRLLLTEKKETAEDVLARVEKVLKEEKKREIVKEIQKVFYCKDCDKQYTNVQQYEEHCNSYDHHHTVRLREMKRLHQQRKMGEKSKRVKAASKREDRALAARIAKAQKLLKHQSAPTAANSNNKTSAPNPTSTSSTLGQQGMQNMQNSKKAKGMSISMSFGMGKKKLKGKRRKPLSFGFGK